MEFLLNRNSHNGTKHDHENRDRNRWMKIAHRLEKYNIILFIYYLNRYTIKKCTIEEVGAILT